MRKTWIIALVAMFTAGLGMVAAGSANAAEICQSSTHVSAKLERYSCNSYVGTVRVTVKRPIGVHGHWEFRDYNGHIRNEPFSGDTWLAPNAGRETTVEWFVPSGKKICANLWERDGSGYVLRGAPCVTVR